MKEYKILLIEPTEFFYKIYSKKLRDHGYQVTVANTAENGLNELSEKKYDCLILELVLPGMNGFNLIKKLKEDRKFDDLPIIVISNLSQKKDINEALNLGAVEFKNKNSISFSEVPELIAGYLPEQ